MRLRMIAAAAAMCAAFVACDGKAGNRQLREAAAVHEEILATHDSIYHRLADKRDEINARIDGLPPDKKSANESMLRSIKKSMDILNTWEESLVGVPGYEFEHHHHHDHDHGDGHHHHHHGRENDKMLRGMSDKEILELQKALRSRLNEVKAEIDNLMDTIEMYERRD